MVHQKSGAIFGFALFQLDADTSALGLALTNERASGAALPPYVYCRAFSMAEVTSGESGFTLGSKRPITVPSRPTRNFVKFHWISPPVFGLAVLSVRN